MTLSQRIRMGGMLIAIGGRLLSATAMLTNGTFETGNAVPQGWHLSDGKGQWRQKEGLENSACVWIDGEGSGSTTWQSEPVPFQPNQTYHLSFHARSEEASGGTAISGPDFANVDIGVPGVTWIRHDIVFATPVRGKRFSVPIRLGQWQVKGRLFFDEARLVPVTPIHAGAHGMTLGEGERLEANHYTFTAPLRGKGRNHSRPLAGFTARFNTDRWCFSERTWVTYRHALTERKWLSGALKIEVGHATAGRLRLEVSTDGTTWQTMSVLTNSGVHDVTLPSALFPVASFRVRLRGGKAPCAIQVGGYTFSGIVDGQPLTRRGTTEYLETLRKDRNMPVTVRSLGDLLPGGENAVRLTVRNATEAPLEREARILFVRPDEPVQTNALRVPLPNPGAYDVRLPYTTPGAGAWRMIVSVGDTFAAACDRSVPAYYRADYGELIPLNHPDLHVWRAASGWKIPPVRALPRQVAKSLTLRLARNEAEAVQLVVVPNRTLTNLLVTVSDLRALGARFPANKVEVLRVGTVPITMTSDQSGTPGPWPDPLLPQKGTLTLAAGRNQTFWIRVTTPRDIPAGLYRGTVTLTADGMKAATVLSVEIYDFTLPDTMTCETAFGFNANAVWRYHKATDPAQRRAVLDSYLRCLGEHRLSPYDPAPMDRWSVTWRGVDARTGKPEPGKKVAEIEPVFRWDEWDAAMTRAFESNRFNTFRIRIEGLGGGTFHARTEPSLLGFAGGTPEYELLMGKYLRGIESHLREKGWLDKAFVYWFDEPDPKDYDVVMNGMNTLKRHAPGLRRMLTEQIEPRLFGGPDIWCPLTPSLNKAGLEERRKAGDHFWWYICCGPKAPYATAFIDHPGPALRVWLWQTWAERVSGILIWETVYWTSHTAYPEPQNPQNPYRDPMSWTSGYGVPKGTRRPWGNGDGRFLYPPMAAADGNPDEPVLDGPVPSLRLEMLRDGIEDYEYFAMLQRLLQQKGGEVDSRTRQNLEALLTVPPEVSASLTAFTRDPAPIEAHREKLARAIVSLLKYP